MRKSGSMSMVIEFEVVFLPRRDLRPVMEVEEEGVRGGRLAW